MPRYVDGTTVGGCSFIIMVGTPCCALHHGLCDVAVISHGESGRSGVGVTPRRDTAHRRASSRSRTASAAAPTYFGLITTRHMHEYGTTLEQWAQVAVSTRKWAALNPKAKNRDPITVKDVLDSRPVVWPFNVLNICLVTDAGGAVVLTRADRARDCAKKPVYVRGAGEGAEHVSAHPDAQPHVQRGHADLRREGVRHGGRGPARLRPRHALRRVHLRAADHAGGARLWPSAGEGVSFFEEGRSTPGGSLPINTNGGGLSYTHSGMYGIFPIIESVAPAARRVRRAAGAERAAVAGQRHGRHALGGGHAGAGERQVAPCPTRARDDRRPILRGPTVTLRPLVEGTPAPWPRPHQNPREPYGYTRVPDGVEDAQHLG